MSSTSDSPRPAAKKVKAKKSRHSLDAPNFEGDNREWAYTPPRGYSLADHDVDCHEFDWDAVKDDDLELWLIRTPEGVRVLVSALYSFSTPCRSSPNI